MARTGRQKALREALRLLVPAAPLADVETLYDEASRPHMRDLPVEAAAWLAALAHIRHQYTDYDALRDDGYDRESALHFIADDINEVLTRWRATRLLDPEALTEEDVFPSDTSPERRRKAKSSNRERDD
ncbi:DUF2293 domain-containing protein [Notoacmeibacter marinus]|uniref:DUF2293 domain-containing protein n=1 Tax=Notoacmeibacter marinus TaxID=1876515 RepID=UPI0026A9629F